MNIYSSLNKISNYIEENLFENITSKKLSTLTGINYYSLNNAFSLLSGYTIKEYIRLRRLSNSFILLKSRPVTEIAFMCGYNCIEAFSRAFKKLHGFNPKQAKISENFKFFPKITFKEIDNNIHNLKLEYKTLPTLTLYANDLEIEKGNSACIHNFWVEQNSTYPILQNAEIKYGLVDCKNGKLTYYVALPKRFSKNNIKITLSTGKYISLSYKSYNGLDFSKLSSDISSEYSLHGRDFDIEIYKHGEVELLYKTKDQEAQDISKETK